MPIAEKKDFLASLLPVMEQMYDIVAGAPALALDELDAADTALIVVDMVNGFAKEGALASPRTLAINQNVADAVALCISKGIKVCALCDSHTSDSPEFAVYPPHCLKDSEESRVTDEILAACSFDIICKASTNAFLEREFVAWLSSGKYRNIIITGCCTDICVLHLSTTIKAFFNSANVPARVMVPTNLVETYDLGAHNGDVQNITALYTMTLGGIELYSDIQ